MLGGAMRHTLAARVRVADELFSNNLGRKLSYLPNRRNVVADTRREARGVKRGNHQLCVFDVRCLQDGSLS
jgi:hypothetical protein